MHLNFIVSRYCALVDCFIFELSFVLILYTGFLPMPLCSFYTKEKHTLVHRVLSLLCSV